ncbi:cytosol aminopeptidase family, catalytic domain protein, partial [Vibrio parahaemolyticus EKP-028]
NWITTRLAMKTHQYSRV